MNEIEMIEKEIEELTKLLDDKKSELHRLEAESAPLALKEKYGLEIGNVALMGWQGGGVVVRITGVSFKRIGDEKQPKALVISGNLINKSGKDGKQIDFDLWEGMTVQKSK